jgi:hypothetical protein
LAAGAVRNRERRLRADREVLLIAQAAEAAVCEPILLHELELAIDVGVEAHEEHPSFFMLHERPAAPQDAVMVDARDRVGRR